MEQEQPQGDSESGLLERLGNYLMPPEAPEQAVEASQESDVEQQPEPQPTEEPQQEAQPVDDGLVDLEADDGQTFRVPQAIKDGYLRNSDYTKKTQDAAALTKQAQSVLQQQAEFAKFQEATQEDRQKLTEVQAELKRYKSLDWTNMDTETYIKARGYLDRLKDDAQELEKELGKKAGKFQEESRQRRSEAARNAYDFIGRHVKEWKPDSDTEKEVTRYVKDYGLPAESLAELTVMFPGIAVLAHKASQYDKLQTLKPKAVQQAQKAPPVVKPGAVTSTNAAAAQRDRNLRGQFKKSGDVKDFERLLLARNMIK